MTVVRQCSKCSGPARCARSRDVLAGRRRMYVCRNCAATWSTIEVLDDVGQRQTPKEAAFEQFAIEVNDALNKALGTLKA